MLITILVYGFSLEEADPNDVGWQNTMRILTAQFDDVRHQEKAEIVSKDHPYWQKLRKDLAEVIGVDELDVRLYI